MPSGTPFWKIVERETLQAAASNSLNYHDLLRQLKLSTSSKNLKQAKDKIAELNIDVSNFKRGWADVGEVEIREAVVSSNSKADVVRKLGFKYCGGNSLKPLNKLLKKFDIQLDFNHQKDFETIKQHKHRRTHLLRERGHKCEGCGREEYQYTEVPLELHHIDEDRRNNVKENLSLLCVNCHDQQHNRGKATRPLGHKSITKPHLTLEDLKSDSARRLALIALYGHQCTDCQALDWEDSYLPLHLHHIDEDRSNNEKTNLVLLCGNCHSLRHDKGCGFERHLETQRAYRQRKNP